MVPHFQSTEKLGRIFLQQRPQNPPLQGKKNKVPTTQNSKGRLEPTGEFNNTKSDQSFLTSSFSSSILSIPFQQTSSLLEFSLLHDLKPLKNFKEKIYKKHTVTYWPFVIIMERHHCSYAVILLLSSTIILGLISFSLCFAAEFKRSKKEDLKFNGRLCYLAGSQGFDLGIAALVLLFIAQITGNLLVCNKFCWSGNHERGCKTKQPKLFIISLLLSWISFGVTVILIGAAASMSKSQPLGEGWLDGECYVVKDGIFLGSAIMILITLGLTISLAIISIRRQAEQQTKKVHARCESA